MNKFTVIRRVLPVLLVLAGSCQKPEPAAEEGTDEVLLFVPKPELQATSGSQFIYVTTDGPWTLATDCNWISLDQVSGEGSTKGITLSWQANPSEDARRCTIVLTARNGSSEAALVQSGKNGTSIQPTDLHPDPVAGWLEVPAITDGKLCFFTHDMTISGRKVRNYSFALDPDAKIARWVAYPLNRGLIGNGSRTNAWGLDPKVPTAYQPVIFSGFYGSGSGKWYQRGHQLPSADRYAPGANEATFYGTNMTPQLGELNENAWATLEGMVRNWSNQFDTLYVVTGADLRGSTDFAYDNYNKHIAVPTGYYKALLGYKKSGTVGITSSTGGYTGIAFYFEHRDYGTGTSKVKAQAMTIDALEAMLGEDFFPNLQTIVGKSNADKVESTNDPWWSNN